MTWSNSQRITSDPMNNGNNQDMCWAGFSSTGKYASVWRDRRANNGMQNQPYKIWGSLSLDGGANFTPNFQLSQTDGALMIPIDGNDFLGCALNDTIVYSTWTDKRNGTSNQLFINKYKISQITTIKELSKQNENIIFPNPNNGEFEIQFSNTEEKEITISDVTGKIIYSNKTNLKKYQIKLKEAKGQYFVQIKSKEEQKVYTLLIE
jgi:hypothetical protein